MEVFWHRLTFANGVSFIFMKPHFAGSEETLEIFLKKSISLKQMSQLGYAGTSSLRDLSNTIFSD